MIAEYIQRTILIAPPVLLALTVHEFSHAFIADRMGDPTARMLGRVTLNPLRHLDPLGTIALFASGMFGWARPVPINPRNFRDVSRGLLWVSLAGPLSNVILAVVFAALYRLADAYGSTLALSAPYVFRPLFMMMEASIVINMSLAVFNLIPVPPLDGSKVLSSLLPADKAFQFSKIEPYGFVILFLLILTGAVNWFVSPVVYLATGLLVG